MIILSRSDAHVQLKPRPRLKSISFRKRHLNTKRVLSCKYVSACVATTVGPIAMFLVTSPIVINVPTRGLLAVETMHAIVRWLANLNIKRNITSMFVNKKHRYASPVRARIDKSRNRGRKRYGKVKMITLYTPSQRVNTCSVPIDLVFLLNLDRIV